MIKFGDVFQYEDHDYVFLAKIDGLVYAAEILNDSSTKRIIAFEGKQGERKRSGEILYCYVILQTEAFKNRMAHLNGARDGNADLQFDLVISPLVKEDLICMKKEVLEGPLPLVLKAAIKDIDIR